MTRETFTVRLAKEDFKFSAAHFTIFGPGDAEPLHGHNYRVHLEIRGESLDDLGFLTPFQILKKEIRRSCAELDEKILVPAAAEGLEISHEGGRTIVRFGEREYVFPRAEVRVLPLPNVTVECLARMLWQELQPSVKKTLATHFSLGVEETAGQSCTYAADLSRRAAQGGE